MHESVAPVTNIIRGSSVDGPGLRTVVFLKGCPLRCPWCHNPETQRPEPELLYDARRCIRCLSCVDVCRNGAIDRSREYPVDREKCTACFSCADACPGNALQPAGKKMTADKLMTEILKDRVFYLTSGGGVTFSGGEPLLHPVLLSDVFQRCRMQGIGTCIDTCLAVPRENIAAVIPYTDLFLVDVKHTSRPEVQPDLVFSNIGYLAAKSRIRIRIPVVPGWNDSEEEIAAIVHRLASFKSSIEQVNLLPFHNTAAMKYRYLSRNWKEYEQRGLIPDSRMAQYRALFQEGKFNVTPGG